MAFNPSPALVLVYWSANWRRPATLETILECGGHPLLESAMLVSRLRVSPNGYYIAPVVPR